MAETVEENIFPVQSKQKLGTKIPVTDTSGLPKNAVQTSFITL